MRVAPIVAFIMPKNIASGKPDVAKFSMKATGRRIVAGRPSMPLILAPGDYDHDALILGGRT